METSVANKNYNRRLTKKHLTQNPKGKDQERKRIAVPKNLRCVTGKRKNNQHVNERDGSDMYKRTLNQEGEVEVAILGRP